MFFQISPVRREKKPKPICKQKSPEKIEVLSFGPFAAVPKLFFDGVRVGEKASCKLILRNPTKQEISIFLIRKLPEELNVSYNWESTTIERNSEVLFEITWTPLNKEASYHKISFENSTRTLHRDVPVSFKTSSPPKKSKTEQKKLNNTNRKSPTKKYYSVKPPYISPKRYSPKKKASFKNTPSPQKYTKKDFVSSYKKSYIREEVNPRGYHLKGKENVPTQFDSHLNSVEHFISSENVTFKLDYLNTAERRDTYVLKRENSDIFNDSLETSNCTEIISPTKNQKRPPLTAFNDNALTPNMSTYFKQRSALPDTYAFGFEYKLMHLESFSFTPTPKKNKENLSPEQISTLKNKQETTFDLPEAPPNLNLSSESYTKSRLSSDTYIKDNISFETYVKGNLSGGTYNKDSSIGKIENLSPASIKLSPEHQRKSTPVNKETPPLSAYLAKNLNKDYSITFNDTLDISEIKYSKTESGRTEVDSFINTERFNFIKPQSNNLRNKNLSSIIKSERPNFEFSTPENIHVEKRRRLNIQEHSDSTNHIHYAKPSDFRIPSPENASKQLNHDYVRSVNTNQYHFARSEQLSSIEEESFNITKNSSCRKKSDLDLTANHAKPGGGFTGPKDWSKKGGAAFRISKTTTGLSLKRFTDSICEETKEEAISKISKRDMNTIIIQNPFLLAATNTFDPFIAPQLYVSDEWIDQQEIYFKKWLNSLLTPPQELYSEEKVVDVAKVWQECKKREVEAAPTKEDISNKYHVNAKLNSLRKSAQTLFKSKEISNVLTKVISAIDNGKLCIRQDKDVHLNLSIKSLIMSILLSYNPLWLRIGLETIYNETIPMQSNSDIVGLSTFLINRLFKNPYLIKKYKSVHSPKYASDFNKFFLKKFLILVYFLDQAKMKKLIPHNPCLFCKTGSVKESKELLLTLARELLSAVGDITKFLKFSGYVVTYIQTYIHEFDYAVKNLGVDLRDGVRLTKIMELILLKEDLTNSLRVPAISRLQKVHNMKLVFDSLETAGYKIQYDITPKDIVDGHREKTMSLLWQIIYKFEAPLMVKSATTIQVWFRSLPVVLKRRRLQRYRFERENAAKKIQNWYKRQKLAVKLKQYRKILMQYLYILKIEKSVIKIQTYYRMYRQKSVYRKQIETIKNIQNYSRGWLIRNFYKQRIKSAVIIQSYVRMFVTRRKYIKIQKAIEIIQTWYRRKLQTKKEVKRFQQIQSTTVFIQQRWRANILARKQKQEYQTLKTATINIQRRFRAKHLCQIQKEKYQKLKSATSYIQTWYRSIKTMKIYRKEYLTLKHTVISVEQHYISLRIMKKERNHYQKLKQACIKIQQYYRAYKHMKQAKTYYFHLKTSTLIIQRRFRANQLMKKQLTYHNSLKKSTIFIQNYYRANKAMKIARKEFLLTKKATIKIQIWFKSTIQMRKCRCYYKSLQKATKFIEEKYQAKILMRKEKLRYQMFQKAAITIQKRYRDLINTRQCRNEYSRLKSVAIFIQRQFRANRAAKLQKAYYLQLKTATIILQTRYRARRDMMQCQRDFLTLKEATIKVQTRYRARLLMLRAKCDYRLLRKSTITIQRLYRAKQYMIKDRANYENLKRAVINIQHRWRARKIGKEHKESYEKLRSSILIIQQKWRAMKLMKEELNRYETLRKATILIQRKWSAKKSCQETRKEYLTLKMACLTLQTHWRARQLGKIERLNFMKLKTSSITIQRKFRATLQARIEKRKFEITRKAIITIQTRWRASVISNIEQDRYQNLRKSTIRIQQLWRAKLYGKIQRKYYLELRKSTLILQKRWRALLEGRHMLQRYTLLRKTVIFVQQKWRAKIEARQIRNRYQLLRTSVLIVQSRWRCKILGRKDKKQFQDLKLATVYIQRRWRCLKLTKQAQKDYQQLRNASIHIQRLWRAKKMMKVEQQQYISLKSVTVIVQRRFRAILEMKRQRHIYTIIKKSVVIIQKWYKNCIETKKTRKEYLEKRKAIQEIQKYARGYLVRKKYAEYFTPESRERRRVEKAEKEAAIKIQSFWKGYKSRCIENPELKRIRGRFIKANATALPENTLHNKCKMALQTIAHEHSTLFHINHALEDIDYATRRCQNICVTLGKLLPDQLYLMLSSTSRSLPEMNACIFSVNILISFNKLKETKDCSFVPSYIENLVTLMLHWCDKDSQLFPALCTLFWLFAHTPQWRRFILNLPNIKKKFEKIKDLVTRKANMVKKQGTKGAAVFSSYKNLPMPALAPDWGLDYKNNPFVFTNSVHALNSLMSILNI